MLMSVNNDRGYPDTKLPALVFFRNDSIRDCWANEEDIFLLVFYIVPFLSITHLPIRRLTRQHFF